jgi:hypothetical protein
MCMARARLFGSLIERLSTPGANWRGAPVSAPVFAQRGFPA